MKNKHSGFTAAERAKAHARVIEIAEEARFARKLPSGYASVGDLLTAMQARCSLHPGGLTGVARDVGTPRRSLQRWLAGVKSPSAAAMAAMARELATPIPSGLIVPAPHENYSALSQAIADRVLHHFRGLSGVADELMVERAALRRWIAGKTLPPQAMVIEMAALCARPLPCPPRRAVEILAKSKIPPRRALSKIQSHGGSIWDDLIATWQVGQSIKVDHDDAAGLRGHALRSGQKVAVREIDITTVQVFRTK